VRPGLARSCRDRTLEGSLGIGGRGAQSMRLAERVEPLVEVGIGGERLVELLERARAPRPHEVRARLAHARQRRRLLRTAHRAARGLGGAVIALRERHARDVEEGLERASREARGAVELLPRLAVAARTQEGHAERALRRRIAWRHARSLAQTRQLGLLRLCARARAVCDAERDDGTEEDGE
jgi:hypothetical protein